MVSVPPPTPAPALSRETWSPPCPCPSRQQGDMAPPPCPPTALSRTVAAWSTAFAFAAEWGSEAELGSPSPCPASPDTGDGAGRLWGKV